MHIPEWLEKLIGTREREIILSPDVKVTNYDEDSPHSRLPVGWKHIISSKGRFTIDAKSQKIIF